jgi:ABC-2 type transport system ATP-binding protein
MSLQVQNVTRRFGEQKALDDVSLDVRKGEIVALLGPNGAGKSTMMKIITCYLPQNEGNVWVGGFNVVNESIKVRSIVGYLPENNPLYTDMYVREYLEFVAGIHKLGEKTSTRVKEMIEQTGLGPEHHKKIGALSKGYRQRVGIAQALIHDPEVLILDEPTSGLDPNQLTEIRNLIKEVGSTKTVLLSTHIMQEVEAVCDRVIIINKGQIVADAPTNEIQLLNQANRVIKVEFSAEHNWKNILKMNGIVDVVAESKHRFRIFTNSQKDIRQDIFHYAVNNNLVILEMTFDDQSIEKVFRHLTSENKNQESEFSFY